MSARLTEAQRRLLAEIEGGTTSCAYDYVPAVRLEALGYLVRSESRYGGCVISITEAGRTALHSLQDGSK